MIRADLLTMSVKVNVSSDAVKVNAMMCCINPTPALKW